MKIKTDEIEAEVELVAGNWRVTVNGKSADFSSYAFHTEEQALLAMCSVLSPALLIHAKTLLDEGTNEGV